MLQSAAGICWAHSATVGHITVSSPVLLGQFAAREGDDALVCCDITPAGKYRHGAARSWCRTHQQYWGTRADLAAQLPQQRQRCARHAEPMHYVLDPLLLDLRRCARTVITLADGRLQVQRDDEPTVTVPALAIACDPAWALFPGADIRQVNVTPVALAALLATDTADCMCCARCHHPHLDLGSFASTPHKRHYCGHCGNDSTHSKTAMVSNPLAALAAHEVSRLQFTGSIVHGRIML